MAEENFLDLIVQIVKWTFYFLLILGVPALIYKIYKARRRPDKPVEKPREGTAHRVEFKGLPMTGGRVGAWIADPSNGGQDLIHGKGILRSYMFTDNQRGWIKVLEDFVTDEGEELGTIMDVKGPGMKDVIQSISVQSRRELFRELGLDTPKHTELNLIAGHNEPTWRRRQW